MAREKIEPTRTEEPGIGSGTQIHEEHPAFGLMSANRVSTGPDGSVLFDSDIKHQHSVVVQLSTASRDRDLNRDWLRSEKQIVEVEMSMAQWGAFVSSFGQGNGVPVTIRRTPDEVHVPGIPLESRMTESLKETREAADEAFEEIQEAFAAYDENRNAANRKNLAAKIRNAAPNVEFAGQSLTKHAENVVTKAKADIEAAAARAVERGLAPGEAIPELGSGEAFDADAQFADEHGDYDNTEEVQDAEVVDD